VSTLFTALPYALRHFGATLCHLFICPGLECPWVNPGGPWVVLAHQWAPAGHVTANEGQIWVRTTVRCRLFVNLSGLVCVRHRKREREREWVCLCECAVYPWGVCVPQAYANAIFDTFRMAANRFVRSVALFSTSFRLDHFLHFPPPLFFLTLLYPQCCACVSVHPVVLCSVCVWESCTF